MRRFLEIGILDNGLVKPVIEGTPQAGPLSPLLSSILLDDLDKELERRLKRGLRPFLGAARGGSVRQMLTLLAPKIRGWVNHYKLCDVKAAFANAVLPKVAT